MNLCVLATVARVIFIHLQLLPSCWLIIVTSVLCGCAGRSKQGHLIAGLAFSKPLLGEVRACYVMCDMRMTLCFVSIW